MNFSFTYRKMHMRTKTISLLFFAVAVSVCLRYFLVSSPKQKQRSLKITAIIFYLFKSHENILGWHTPGCRPGKHTSYRAAGRMLLLFTSLQTWRARVPFLSFCVKLCNSTAPACPMGLAATTFPEIVLRAGTELNVQSASDTCLRFNCIYL